MNQHLTFQTVTLNVIDHKGQTWLRAADIAQALGYSRTDKVSRLYSRHASEFTDAMTARVTLPDLDGQIDRAGTPEPRSGVAGQARQVRIFSLRGAHLLGMLAKTATAAAFRVWVLDVLEGVTRAPADLHARLIAAEHAEAQSFAVASLASRAMNQRRREKPRLQGDIQTLNSLVQLALPLAMEGGAA